MKGDLLLPKPVLDALIPLSRLLPSSRQELLEHAAVMNYCPGQYIFMQGDRDDHAFYLLEGEIELHSDGNAVGRVRGRTAEANCALAQLQPRQLSALPTTLVQVLRVDRARLERLLQAEASSRGHAGDIRADDIQFEAPMDWMTRMLQSALFTRLPVANIQRIFAGMEPVEARAGELVVRQGETAEHYYVIQDGQCVIERRIAQSDRGIKLAELGPGERFGEDALIAGTPRSATVRAVTDCSFMRLAKADFIELLVAPVQRPLTIQQACELVGEGAAWLDVRFPEEQHGQVLPGALNVPLHLLRARFGSLAQDRRYIAYCEDGTRSAVAAFLLAERGFDAAYLAGGLDRYPGTVDAGQVAGTLENGGAEAEGGAEAHGTSVEHFPAEQSGDPEVQASLLKAKLAEVRLQLHEALRLKQEANAAREAAERAAEERIQAEKTARSQSEVAHAQALIEEAEARRREVEEATRRAEEEAGRVRRQAEERASRLEAELEGRLRAREQELQSVEATRGQELARFQGLREEAERQLRAERERLAVATREAELRLQEAQQFKEAAEAAARVAEEGTQERLQAERERVKAETERATTLVARAEAMKREVEEARRSAEREALFQRQAEDERIRALQAEFEARLREKERQLEEASALQAQELLEVRRLKDEAATELAKERHSLALEAMEAKRRLAEARRVEHEVEASRIEAAEEAERKHSELVALEQRLREDMDGRLNAEKRRLDEEFARAAEQLALAQREKTQAEAARRAVAAEAAKKVAEYRAEFERMRQAEQAKLEAEKRRLEAEALRIQGAMEEASRMVQEAEVARLAAEQEMQSLKAARAAEAMLERREAIDTKLKALEEQMTRAEAQASAAAKAHNVAEHARLANDAELDRQRAEEERFHSQIEAEVREWRDEQEAFESSPEQVELSIRRKEQMARVNQQAAEARRAAAEHDRCLVEELGALLN